MKYADLHIHSNYSDGIKSPEEIIDSAIKDNIKYFFLFTLTSSLNWTYFTIISHAIISKYKLNKIGKILIIKP